MFHTVGTLYAVWGVLELRKETRSEHPLDFLLLNTHNCKSQFLECLILLNLLLASLS